MRAVEYFDTVDIVCLATWEKGVGIRSRQDEHQRGRRSIICCSDAADVWYIVKMHQNGCLQMMFILVWYVFLEMSMHQCSVYLMDQMEWELDVIDEILGHDDNSGAVLDNGDPLSSVACHSI